MRLASQSVCLQAPSQVLIAFDPDRALLRLTLNGFQPVKMCLMLHKKPENHEKITGPLLRQEQKPDEVQCYIRNNVALFLFKGGTIFKIKLIMKTDNFCWEIEQERAVVCMNKCLY